VPLGGVTFGEMSAQEVAFWFWRVSEFSVTGIVGDGPLPVGVEPESQIISNTFAPLHGGEVANYLNGGAVEASFLTGGVPVANEYVIDIGMGGAFLHTNPDDAIGWNTLLGFQLGWHTSDGHGGAIDVVQGGSTPALSAFTLTFSGTNALTGETYHRAIPCYDQGPSGRALSGGVTITPIGFWPFADDAGNPLYDTASGARL